MPFSVYLGWISIETITKISVALIAAGWDGFGIESTTWTIFIIAVAVTLSLAMLATRKDVTLIWWLFGRCWEYLQTKENRKLLVWRLK